MRLHTTVKSRADIGRPPVPRRPMYLYMASLTTASSLGGLDRQAYTVHTVVTFSILNHTLKVSRTLEQCMQCELGYGETTGSRRGPLGPPVVLGKK